MDETRKKVTLQHPADVNLQVTIWEGTLADTLRRHGYIEVVDEEDERQTDGKHDVDGGSSAGTDRQ